MAYEQTMVDEVQVQVHVDTTYDVHQIALHVSWVCWALAPDGLCWWLRPSGVKLKCFAQNTSFLPIFTHFYKRKGGKEEVFSIDWHRYLLIGRGWRYYETVFLD
jgi:hypothetical protein